MTKRKILKRVAFPYCDNEPLVDVDDSAVDFVFVREQKTENGRIVSRLVEKTVDRQELSKGTNFLDYCLENQIAIGADGLRTPVFLGSSDIDSTLSSLDAAGANMDSAAAAAAAASAGASS